MERSRDIPLERRVCEMLQEKLLGYLDYRSGTSGKKCVGFFRMEVYEQTCDLEICVQGMRVTDDFERDVLLRGAGNESGEEKEYVFDHIRFSKGQATIRHRHVEKSNLFQSGVDSDHLWEICIPIASGAEISCEVRRKPVIKKQKDRDKTAAEVPEPEVVHLLSMEDMVQDSDSDQSEESISVGFAEVEAEVGVKSQEKFLEKEESGTEEVLQATEAREPSSPQLPRMSEEKWAQLVSIYPKVNPFQDRRTYLKLGLQDFVLLPEKYYTMCKNSFLLHGYMNYGYLLLASYVKRGMYEYYLGVPGVFYEKERQVAKLYGFDFFEADRENAREGDFGIYFMKIAL